MDRKNCDQPSSFFDSASRIQSNHCWNHLKCRRSCPNNYYFANLWRWRLDHFSLWRRPWVFHISLHRKWKLPDEDMLRHLSRHSRIFRLRSCFVEQPCYQNYSKNGKDFMWSHRSWMMLNTMYRNRIIDSKLYMWIGFYIRLMITLKISDGMSSILRRELCYKSTKKKFQPLEVKGKG